MTDIVKLPARLDLSAAPGLVADLQSQDFSKELTLDASEVKQMGALCTQAIISAARASYAAGGSLTMKDASERVQNQLACMGLSIQDLEGGVQ